MKEVMLVVKLTVPDETYEEFAVRRFEGFVETAINDYADFPCKIVAHFVTAITTPEGK